MQIWKYLGLNTRETRERMNEDNNRTKIENTRNTNWHITIQTIAVCVVLAVGLYACAQAM